MSLEAINNEANDDRQMTLPFVTLDSPTLSTRQLQTFSGKKIEDLNKGPHIIVINGEKQAVLVSYKQYTNFQNHFRELFKAASIMQGLFGSLTPKVPEGYRARVHQVSIEVSGTLEKIAHEIPDSSPLADVFDALLAVGVGLFKESKNAPAVMKKSVKKALAGTRKVVKKGVKPRKPTL